MPSLCHLRCNCRRPPLPWWQSFAADNLVLTAHTVHTTVHSLQYLQCYTELSEGLSRMSRLASTVLWYRVSFFCNSFSLYLTFRLSQSTPKALHEDLIRTKMHKAIPRIVQASPSWCSFPSVHSVPRWSPWGNAHTLCATGATAAPALDNSEKTASRTVTALSYSTTWKMETWWNMPVIHCNTL